MKKKILLTRPYRFPPQTEQKLKNIADTIVIPGPTESELLPLVRDVHGIIAHNTVISESIIQASPLLQVISTPQVGYDKIDVTAATRAGVLVVTAAGLAPGTVAEFTLGLMIALARRIVQSSHDLCRERDWSVRTPYLSPSLEMGTDLRGLTIGLVGTGSIGSAVARLCQAALTARILAYDPFVSREKMATQGIEKREGLIEIAREADFLSLHLPLTDESRHLINETILRAMKPGAYLINCARGAIVDEKALAIALQEKWISGAAMDVFEEEPISPDNPLLNMRNMICTPHIAGLSIQSSVQRGEDLVNRLIDVFAGKKPEGLANPEVWPIYLEKIR